MDMVRMARIGGPVGLEGWCRFQSYASDHDVFLSANEWRLRLAKAQQWSETAIEGCRSAGSGLAVKLAGCDDRDAAEQLRGAELGLPRSALPALAEGEYYWHDLVGAAVRNVEGESLGTVREVLDMPANPVLVAVRDERETLVPLTDRHIVSVDIAAGEVLADWPADL